MDRRDIAWFDQKYLGGLKPTIRDRAELLSKLELHLSDRAKKSLLEYLDQTLIALASNGSYSPALDLLTYELLSLSLMAGIEQTEFDKRLNRYRTSLSKYERVRVFQSNFPLTEE